MPYINADGNIVEKRSNFRLSIISDFFIAVLNIIMMFFDTLINPTKPLKKNYDRDREIARKRASGDPSFGPKGSNIKGFKGNDANCASGG